MCGLMAWWPQRPDADDMGYFQAGLEALTPRGPDEEGQWHAADGSCHMGHRRLRITGVRGTQPLWNEQGSVCILVNGEFYEAGAWRERLASEGHVFTSDSDSEILLPLYERYGFEALEHLEGEFAFVLWDRSQDLVWAVRDRAGVKPLRFAHDARGLAFASEAKALFAAGWKAKWDAQSLLQALTVQYVQPDRTLFAGIRQLAPGQAIVFRQDDQGQWQEHAWQWWSWFSKPRQASAFSPEQATQQLRMALERAVGRRVDTHWPIAAHLSGGLDSTAIAWLASRMHPGQVRAYTVGFDPPDEGGQVQHDECAVARATAAALGLHWTRVEAPRALLLRHWADAVERAEGLGVNGHLVAKWLLARQIHADGLRVSLSGEGADENLMGYAFLAAEHPQCDSAQIARDNPVARGVMLPEGSGVDLRVVAQQWGFVPVWLQAKATLGARLHGLLEQSWTDHIDAALHAWATASTPMDSTPVQQACGTWARVALGGYILPALADAPEAGFAIQGRVPFLDRDLMETVQAWDPTLTGWPALPKAPLRRMLDEAGLEDVARRPKHPFEAPPLWGCETVRSQLRAQWSAPGAFDHTPVCQQRVAAMMDMLDRADAATQQLWEPVVATLLSLTSLRDRFNVRGFGAP